MRWSVALTLLLLAGPVRAAEPTAVELLRQYDAIMGPENYEGVATMVAHRDDDTTRTYKMKLLKAGDEKFRLSFTEPAAVRGQELLRQGDNSWLYMPSLKRAVRMANRDNFQGGDFNNADVLRVNYTADYDATLAVDPGKPDAWLIDLKAKSTNAAYDRVKLWIHKGDYVPLRGEYYTASGKLLRAAEFTDMKDFGGFKRPATVVMKNMLATKRYSTMTFETFNTRVKPPSSKFVLDDLGR